MEGNFRRNSSIKQESKLICIIALFSLSLEHRIKHYKSLQNYEKFMFEANQVNYIDEQTNEICDATN